MSFIRKSLSRKQQSLNGDSADRQVSASTASEEHKERKGAGSKNWRKQIQLKKPLSIWQSRRRRERGDEPSAREDGTVEERDSGGGSARSTERTPLPLQAARRPGVPDELGKLAREGWYWGPVSRQEAEDKLRGQPDGTFLVRDSSSDSYLFTVSFRSSGKTLHSRIDYNGHYSLYSSLHFESIGELIAHSMSQSQSAVYCYSQPNSPTQPEFPVRLSQPLSRFTQVRSLQYLCRFVIRQHTGLTDIQKLPLPQRIKGYIQEGHY